MTADPLNRVGAGSRVQRATPSLTHRRGGSGPGRVLLLSYYFPPNPATGAVRWQKLCQFGTELGWEFDVVALDPSSLPERAPSEAVPEGVRLIGIPDDRSAISKIEDWLLARLKSVGRLVRRQEADGGGRGGESQPPSSGSGDPSLIRREDVGFRPTLSDAKRAYLSLRDIFEEARWARRAGAAALSLARERHYDVVVTCGPPHMVHDAGRRVSRRTGIPLVVDQRDAWSVTPVLRPQLASPVWLGLARHFEERAVRHAQLVVGNTPLLRDTLIREFGLPEEKVITVLNGFDRTSQISAPDRTTFTVAYAGNIYIDRNPRLFFRAARRFADRESLSLRDLQLLFIGGIHHVGDTPLSVVAEQECVADFLHTEPRMSRERLFDRLADASVLLSLPQDIDLAIPSKIYEYMQFPAWILALAQKGTATELLLRQSDADVVPPDDLDGMTEALTRRYRSFRMGVAPEPLANSMDCSRQTQAQLLFSALDGVTSTTWPATEEGRG